MKRTQLPLLMAGLMVAGIMVSGQALAASDTATADATVDIVSPISIAKGTDLVFGKIAKPNTGLTKTVVVTTAGVCTGGDADRVGAQTCNAAAFTVTADATYAYTATVSYTAAVATGATLGTVLAKCGAGGDVAIDSGGTAVSCLAAVTDLKVGGTLSVTDTISTGTVTGTDTITVVVAYD